MGWWPDADPVDLEGTSPRREPLSRAVREERARVAEVRVVAVAPEDLRAPVRHGAARAPADRGNRHTRMVV